MGLAVKVLHVQGIGRSLSLPDPDARVCALTAALELKPETVEPLVETIAPLLNDSQANVRRTSFDVLCRANKDLLVPHIDSIRTLVCDSNLELRQRAVVFL